jgi:ubiquinone/menaquinone biosynthesis C-methylase UbiE
VADKAKRDFDGMAAAWDDNPGRVEVAGGIVRAVVDRLPLRQIRNMLDYGAGTGLVTLGLYPYVTTIMAADSSKGMLEVLRRKVEEGGLGGIRTVLLDLERQAPPDEHFDLIVSAMTMHHIEDVAGVVRKLCAMLRPGGYLAIADLDLDDGEFHTDPTGVMHNGLDRGELARLLADSGLSHVEVETAHTIHRDKRDFTVFLMTGEKAQDDSQRC